MFWRLRYVLGRVFDLKCSIVSSVTVYSAQRLRSVSAITEKMFVLITALECSMGRAIYKYTYVYT